MNANLAGRTAFVTGASSGLGRHFARVLAGAGARVGIAGRRVERLAALAAEITKEGGAAQAVALDVTDPSRIAPAFDEIEAALGPVDILINNAGISIAAPATEMSIEDFDAVIGTNLRGPFLVAREAGRRMIARRKGGRVINIASIAAFRPMTGLAAYCMSKAAVAMMTQCLAREWARHDITVNAICPGYIETEINGEWFRTEKGQAQIRSFLKRRLQKESDLDGALLLFASDGSAAITGSLLTVDDGQSL